MRTVNRRIVTLLTGLGLSLVFGCDSGSGADNANTCDVGDLSAVCTGGAPNAVTLSDAYNFTFESTLHMSSTVVKGAAELVDLTFDWSGVTQDFIGRTIDPLADIDMVLITVWSLSQSELADQINNDALDQQYLLGGGALTIETGNAITSENLIDFTLAGTPITAEDDIKLRDSFFNAEADNYDPEAYTHMVMVQSGTTMGKNARMLQLFTLDADSAQTQVNVTSSSTTLSYTADLRSQKRIPATTGNPSISINWDNLNYNSMGNEFVGAKITQVVVAHYDMTPCELEENFLGLESDYDEWYSAELTDVAYEYDLSQLTDASGNSFPGITSDGIWIVALFCGTCANPAPWFMTVLHPC